MNLPFTKLQSIGNDFPLFEQKLLLERGFSGDLSKLAIAAADRHFGIGGDGILVITQPNEGEPVGLTMYNPDGTEDFCGNGIRIAALYAHQKGWAGQSFTIKHQTRLIPITIAPDRKIATTIGKASYKVGDVPLTGPEIFDDIVWDGMDSGTPLAITGSALTTGSTHVVIQIAALPDEDTFRAISPRIERDLRYPMRTSVIWSQQTSPMELKIRIWERGVGETMGCGTGSSAAAADYLRRKNKGGTVKVVNPGGTILVEMGAWDQPITITGEAQSLFEGEFEL